MQDGDEGLMKMPKGKQPALEVDDDDDGDTLGVCVCDLSCPPSSPCFYLSASLSLSIRVSRQRNANLRGTRHFNSAMLGSSWHALW